MSNRLPDIWTDKLQTRGQYRINKFVFSIQSSLLLTLLNQMPTTSGCVKTSGKVAYVPQEAWIFSGSFRENILFGCPMNQQKYDETLATCALFTVGTCTDCDINEDAQILRIINIDTLCCLGYRSDAQWRLVSSW